MKEIALKNILTVKELEQLITYYKNGNYSKAKQLLQSKKKELLAKGILPDYLFYYLQYLIEVKGIL